MMQKYLQEVAPPTGGKAPTSFLSYIDTCFPQLQVYRIDGALQI